MNNSLDDTLIYVNQYGTIVEMPISELQAEADRQDELPERFAIGMKFAISLALPLWLGLLYWWLK